MKNIIAAVDFSNATPAVMEIAISLAKAFDADLQLLHVIEPEPTFVTYGFSVAEYPAMASLRDETIRRAKTRIEELLAQARKDVPRVVSHLPEGSPLLELLKQVNQSGADFVVIGSHGHGVLSSLLLGSVAEGMVRKATVPTLIVPAARE
jgi:nucleotide-binding universal stress UspA family protein